MWTSGQQLGRFRLDREIGQGSHGVVWLATDTALSTQVAIKILHPWLTEDIPVRDRFKRELLLARRIAHPGICRLFDLHEEAGAFFITMDYVEGETLLNVLKREGRLPPARGAKIMRGVCGALAAAHQAGVIHRDLKPANIIVKDGDEPMILDFGTATAQDVSRVTRPGTAVGSMRFIAPEIFTGTSPSAATDIYSLGVVAYVTLAGRLPYNAAAGAIEMLEMIRGQAPMRLDALEQDIPARLADVVARAMHRDPAARFSSAVAFAEGLAEVEAGLTRGQPAPSTGDFARWAPTDVANDSVAPAPLAITAEASPGAAAEAPAPLIPAVPPAMNLSPAPLSAASEEAAGVDVPQVQDTVITNFFAAELPGAAADAAPPSSDVTVVQREPPEHTVRVARLDIAQVETGRVRVTPRRPTMMIAAAAAVVGVIVVAVVLATGDDDVLAADAGVALADAGLATGSDAGDAAALAVGALVDGGAAAAVLAVVDAGEPADAGAGGAMAFTADDFEDEPIEADDAGPSARPRPRADRNDGEIKAVRQLLLRRGFIPGDLPSAEQQLKKARAAARAGRSSDAASNVAQARAIIEGQQIDRAFVLSKLNRFNTRFDRSKRPELAGRVTPLASEAATSFSAGQFDVANQKLNRAFALIGR